MATNIMIIMWKCMNGPHSPDLKPIEHLLAILNRKVGNLSLRKNEELKEAETAAWAKITPEETKNLVESIPRHLEAQRRTHQILKYDLSIIS